MSLRLLAVIVLCAGQISCVTAYATELIDAARRNQQATVAALIASGADVNEQGQQGDVPLHWAVFNGDAEIVRTLIDAGADVNDPLANGNVPLHIAAHRGHAAIVEILLRRGADPERRNRDGNRPLDLARAGRHETAAQLLAGVGGQSEIAVAPSQPLPTRPVPGLDEVVAEGPPATYLLQLVAVSSEARARRAVADYRDRFADLLDGGRLRVTAADGSDDPLYRIQYGPLSLDGAQSLCTELRRREQPCLVRATPGG